MIRLTAVYDFRSCAHQPRNNRTVRASLLLVYVLYTQILQYKVPSLHTEAHVYVCSEDWFSHMGSSNNNIEHTCTYQARRQQ